MPKGSVFKPRTRFLSGFCKKSIFRVGIQKNGASCTPDDLELALGQLKVSFPAKITVGSSLVQKLESTFLSSKITVNATDLILFAFCRADRERPLKWTSFYQRKFFLHP